MVTYVIVDSLDMDGDTVGLGERVHESRVRSSEMDWDDVGDGDGVVESEGLGVVEKVLDVSVEGVSLALLSSDRDLELEFVKLLTAVAVWVKHRTSSTAIVVHRILHGCACCAGCSMLF